MESNRTNEFIINEQMDYVHFLVRHQNYSSAITVLEDIRSLLDKDREKHIGDYLEVLDILSSVYSIEKEHRKSADLTCEMIDLLMERHTQKYGDVLTKDNIDFDMCILNKIISLHLDAGASFSRLGEYHIAKQYLEKGYFLAFYSYGDQDERTLKLNYNLAVNEMEGFDQKEGLRQLHFVYEDMVKYLGTDNQYTKKACEVIEKIDQQLKMLNEEREYGIYSKSGVDKRGNNGFR